MTPRFFFLHRNYLRQQVCAIRRLSGAAILRLMWFVEAAAPIAAGMFGRWSLVSSEVPSIATELFAFVVLGGVTVVASVRVADCVFLMQILFAAV